MSQKPPDVPVLTPPPDEYESEYMPGGGQVLHRSKLVARRLALLMLTLGVLMGVLAGVSFFTGPLFASIMLAFGSLTMLFVSLGLSVMRTKVTSEELHVQYGLWGPRVPITAITSCNVIPYDWKKFGGWGIKRSMDGVWSYTPTMVERVVAISWTDDKGKTKKAVFAAEDPDSVVAAVRKARTQPTATASGRVRVSAEAGADDGIVDAEFEERESERSNATPRTPSD